MTARLLIAALLPALAIEACPTNPPEPETCVRPLADADRTRFGVVAFPYGPGGSQANSWGVFEVAPDGSLSLGSERFEMGRAYEGEVVFTPDGQIGIAVQEDGSLGVFRLGNDGSVDVIDAGLSGEFYAGQVVIAPEGDRAFVVDLNWQENGGGIYEVGIACDGTVFERGMLVDSKLAYAMALLPRGDQAVIAARELGDSTPGDDLHRVALDGALTPLEGTDAFGHDDAIVSSLEVSPDGGLALIGDNSFFSASGNAVAVVDVDSFSPLQLFDVEDPVDIEISPFGGEGIIVSGFGDAIFSFTLNEGAAEPVELGGPLSYNGARPQLPASAVLIERGAATGHVIVGENTALRRLRFEPGGGITDLGPYDTGMGYESITGALGIQP